VTSSRASDERLIQALANSVAYITAACGFKSDDLAAAMERAYQELGEPPELEPSETSPRPVHRQLAKVLSLWASSQDYTDDLGDPIPIPKSGPAPSLEHLFRQAKRLFNESAQSITYADAMDLLQGHGAIVETADGTYMPGKTLEVNVHPIGSVAPFMALSYLTEYAQTTEHNIRTRVEHNESAPTYFQKVASTENFPITALPKIRAMLDGEGVAFLRQVDRFIETAARTAADDEKRVFVGVGLYMLRSDGDRFSTSQGMTVVSDDTEDGE